MKLRLLLAIFLLACFSSLAKSIDKITAMSVAKNFYAQKANGNRSMSNVVANLSTAYECKAKITENGITAEQSLYYVFNKNTDDGFIIVSGDDVAIPVLGYTTSGSFHGDHLPPAFEKWLESYKQQLLYAKQKFSVATYPVKASWDELLNASNNVAYRQMASSSVNALLSTTWDQEPYYNDYCPYDPDAYFDHCPTGCVATAMAQIMKYWSYPAQGTGFHSYYSYDYGTLSADFGNTSYNWAAMPNFISSSNSQIATLMYQCGVSVEMNYAPYGSGAYVISDDDPVCSQTAYASYFGYDGSSMQGLKRDVVNNFTSWKNMLKGEIDAARPVQYVGFGSGGGHTWVCDGYDVNDYFHMNWGWGGAGPNGFYALDALNPPALGTGGGDGGFNYNQEMLIGIKPVSTSSTDNIAFYGDMQVSSDPVFCIGSFSVTLSLYNAGSTDFSGIFSVALFKPSGEFVQYVQVIAPSNPLPPNYGYSPITFVSDGQFIEPGDYVIGAYYMRDGGGWELVNPNGYNGYHQNPITLTVVGPQDYLRLYADINPTPTTFMQGSPATVTLNVQNTYPYTYYGTIWVGLFDLNGSLIQIVDTFGEKNGLLTNHYYNSPLTFHTSDVSVDPGTYMLACFYHEYGTSYSYPVGGQLYANPVTIDVVAAGLSPDIYETNNDFSSAYQLSTAWSSNASNPNTVGSNLHISTDLDYYKIALPGGYSYSITARANDSYSTDDANSYSADVLWSYNSGSGWSYTYDDVKSSPIVVNGAGTVTFKVAPYFSGSIGTYLFKMHIVRTPLTAVNEITNDKELNVYPNPAGSLIRVEIPGNKKIDNYFIVNSLGAVVMNNTPASGNATIDVSSLSLGIYSIIAITNDEKYFSRFVINR